VLDAVASVVESRE